MTDVWIVRHGQTEWSRDGRHTGRSDIPLTDEGEDQARALRPVMDRLSPDLVLVSPRQRARCTAELAGLERFETVDDLAEWDYGDLEGRTTPDIHEDIPGWNIWGGPWPGGETATEVAIRADTLLARVRSSGAERVVLVGHGHFSRVLAARWVGESPATGRFLLLDTATWSHLGWDRGVPAIVSWNVPA